LYATELNNGSAIYPDRYFFCEKMYASGYFILLIKELQLYLVAIIDIYIYNYIEGDNLSKKDKLTKRFLSRPADFTFNELTTLLGSLGYSMETTGKTGGSRVSFSNQYGDYIRLHKPHPRNILKLYQIDDITANLKEKGKL